MNDQNMPPSTSLSSSSDATDSVTAVETESQTKKFQPQQTLQPQEQLLSQPPPLEPLTNFKSIQSIVSKTTTRCVYQQYSQANSHSEPMEKYTCQENMQLMATSQQCNDVSQNHLHSASTEYDDYQGISPVLLNHEQLQSTDDAIYDIIASQPSTETAPQRQPAEKRPLSAIIEEQPSKPMQVKKQKTERQLLEIEHMTGKVLSASNAAEDKENLGSMDRNKNDANSSKQTSKTKEKFTRYTFGIGDRVRDRKRSKEDENSSGILVRIHGTKCVVETRKSKIFKRQPQYLVKCDPNDPGIEFEIDI